MGGSRSWSAAALLLAAAGLAACSGLAGCGPAGGNRADGASAAEPFSAAKLRGALLTRINGVPTAAPAASGDYASLPDGSPSPREAASPGEPASPTEPDQGQAGPSSASSVTVIPAACGGATMSGFNPAALAGAPAAAATFRVGGNGVSETLVASSAVVAASALAGRFPAACEHYRETVAGRVFRYTASESAVSGVGQQARLLHVRPAGNAPDDDLWSLVYRAAGFVGSVTVVGPDASVAAVRELGRQAYAFATASLT